MAFVDPGYTVPGQTYVTSQLEVMHSEMVDSLEEIIESAEVVALTTDIWSSLKMEAYCSATLHSLDGQWKLRRYVLATLPLEDRHTAVNIMNWLTETVASFQIQQSKVVAVVHDNASNVVAAVDNLHANSEQGRWVSVRCAGHSLQL